MCTAYGDHYEVNGTGDHPDQHCQVQTQAQVFVLMSIAKTCKVPPDTRDNDKHGGEDKENEGSKNAF